MSYCYILYSKSLDSFYVGSCQDFKERLEKHNQGFYGKQTYTSITNDWELFLDIETNVFAHARRLELKIKKMKSRVYIQNLKKYPELVEKIKAEST